MLLDSSYSENKRSTVKSTAFSKDTFAMEHHPIFYSYLLTKREKCFTGKFRALALARPTGFRVKPSQTLDLRFN